MNSRELYNELKQLARLGYLEQAQVDRIQDEYIHTRKEHRSIFLIFALVGVIFIGAGVISLFAWNWSMFPKEIKAAAAFLPLLGVQGVLYWKVRAKASELWIKSLTLALGIAFLSALGLIYQAYQISYSLTSMMMTGFLLMLPVVYLLDGYYLSILYMAGICWTGGFNWTGGFCWAGSFCNSTLPVLLLLPYYIKRVKKGENCGLLSLCFFIWFLYLAVIYVPDHSFYACILILLIYMTIDPPALYGRLAGRLIYGMLFLKTVFYSFFNDLTEIFHYGYRNQSIRYLPEFLLFLLLAGAVIRICLFIKKKPAFERLNLLLYGIICGLLTADLMIYQLTYQPVSPLAGQAIITLCFTAFSLYRLLCGVKRMDLASVRRYTASVILCIILRVFLEGYGLLVKGVVFVIAGLAFLAVNYRMSLKLKELKEVKTYENSAE